MPGIDNYYRRAVSWVICRKLLVHNTLGKKIYMSIEIIKQQLADLSWHNVIVVKNGEKFHGKLGINSLPCYFVTGNGDKANFYPDEVKRIEGRTITISSS